MYNDVKNIQIAELWILSYGNQPTLQSQCGRRVDTVSNNTRFATLKDHIYRRKIKLLKLQES